MCCWGSDLCSEDALTRSFGRIRGSAWKLYTIVALQKCWDVNTLGTYSGT